MTNATLALLSSNGFRDLPPGFARLRTGSLISVDEWSTAFTDARQMMRAQAFARTARTPPVFSHLTALALHGIPLSRRHDAVHVIPRGPNPPKTHLDVIRHKLALPASDVTEIHGLLATTLDRAVADSIRLLPGPAALAVMDGALRKVAWDDERHLMNADAAADLRARVARRIAAASGGRGVRVARVVVELGDGRAQLPGESESRYLMAELHMPMPVLQLRVLTSLGEFYLDFAWPRLRRFGEFDGLVKLTDPDFAGGRSPAEVLDAQRQRRAAIEEATGWKSLHWGWADRKDAGTLWSSLTAQGWPAHAHA